MSQTTQPSDWAVELLPCPMCGGSADSQSYIVEAVVWCSQCRLRIVRRHGALDEHGLREAIAAWNTRAPVARELDASGDAPRSAEAGDWQPIESAPKDGTRIEAYSTHSGQLRSTMWKNGEWHGWIVQEDGLWWGDSPCFWRPLPKKLPPKGAVGAGDRE